MVSSNSRISTAVQLGKAKGGDLRIKSGKITIERGRFESDSGQSNFGGAGDILEALRMGETNFGLQRRALPLLELFKLGHPPLLSLGCLLSLPRLLGKIHRVVFSSVSLFVIVERFPNWVEVHLHYLLLVLRWTDHAHV